MIGLAGGRPVILIILVVRGADSREPVRRNTIKMSCIYHIIQTEILTTNDAGKIFNYE